ncbi:hypothetical protein TCAL_12153 [Tigriopus californicus]|uniref:C-type lectin domain-containing protein n=1 Tax=Tigriopus californicus TaxID=6832 RepID=A0A553PK14_TIGCA|nr:hypothetical protein TCAL_12153 [Tigriopus californicus]
MQGTGKFCVFIAAFIFICPICHCLLDTVTGLLGGSNNNGNTDNENVEKNTGGSTASTACSPPEGYTDNIDGFSYRDYGETLNYWKAMSTCHKNRARLPLFKGEAMYNTIKGILRNLSYTVGLLANVNETRAQAIPANEALRFLKWNDGTTPLDLQFMTETIIFDEGEMCMTIFKDKHLSDTPCRNRTHTFCQFPCADEGKEQRNQW